MFITDLFNLVEHCNFDVLREELIRERIVVGIRDKALAGKATAQSRFNFRKCCELCSTERDRKQQGFLRGDGKQQIDHVGVSKIKKE